MTRILEHDLKGLFTKHPRQTRLERKISQILGFSASFTGLFALFFLLFNFPAYAQRVTWITLNRLGKTTSSVLENSSTKSLLPRVSSGPGQMVVPTQAREAGALADNHIFISKINLSAPVVWGSRSQTILQDLERGVAHFAGTARPGEPGNVFITGHSSNFWWNKGRFNQVFALLDQLDKGDQIVITYQGKQYWYQVFDQMVVKPNQTEVLDPTDQPILSLMTCTPVGTTLKRLVIRAKQVDPTPSTDQKTIQRTKPPSILPAIR